MRKILGASVLVLALCCPALAGDIPCPAPLPSGMTMEEPTTEATGTNYAEDDAPDGVADGLMETVRGLLAAVLALV